MGDPIGVDACGLCTVFDHLKCMQRFGNYTFGGLHVSACLVTSMIVIQNIYVTGHKHCIRHVIFYMGETWHDTWLMGALYHVMSYYATTLYLLCICMVLGASSSITVVRCLVIQTKFMYTDALA